MLAFLIGPVFFVLLETAAIKGFKAALAFDLGVVIADLFFILVAYLSTNQILEKIKDEPGLYIFGGMLLTIYGMMSHIKDRKNYKKLRNTAVEIVNKKHYLLLFAKGFLLNFINIGVLGFWVGVIVIFGPRLNMEMQRIISFFATVLLTYLGVDLIKIFLAKKLRSKLSHKRIYFIKNVISLIMVVFGFFLIGKGIVPKD